MNEIERIIEIAKAEIGYLEKKSNKDLDSKTANAGNGNYTKYARDLDNVAGFYNGKKNGYDWCDIFVDWCFYKAFGVTRALELLCQPQKSCGAGVYYSAQYYKNKKQFYTSNPQAGDQVFLNKYNHTGLVIKVDGNYIYTIEGNTSSPVNCVKKKKYALNSTYIVGYGRPNYAEDIIEPVEPNEPVEPTPAPEIIYGLEVGDKVKIIKTGNASADGDKHKAIGIGWIRYVTKIHKGHPYPYQVGNKGKTGNADTTGFYKEEALKKL